MLWSSFIACSEEKREGQKRRELLDPLLLLLEHSPVEHGLLGQQRDAFRWATPLAPRGKQLLSPGEQGARTGNKFVPHDLEKGEWP